MKILVELQLSQKSLDEMRDKESIDSFNVQYDDDETDGEFLKRIVNEKLSSCGIKANKVSKV